MTDILNDRYELGDVIGTGGMGAVYRATDLRLGRTVAVKILRGGPLADDVARARMRSEASLAASINHPGVAQIFDYDEASASHGGLSFMVMELVEGHTLAQLLRERGPMPAEQVMSVVVQVAEGLQAAHEVGVVHRDLKPANVMLTPAGRTVLVDFGIARSATSEPLTDTGAMVGTAEYMSPEQAAGRAATPQSDLYALGVMAHHCLTGTSPFRRESQIATALAHLNDELPPLPDGVPPEVRQLLVTLTAKNPEDRPTTAGAVALTAASIGAASSIDLPATFEQPIVSGLASAPTQVVDAVPAADPVATKRRRRPAVYAGVGAAVLSLGLLGFQNMQQSDPATVPNVVGMSSTEAKAEISDAGMSVSTRTVDLPGESAGQVVEQSPKGGQPEPEGEPVTISVVSGKVRVSAQRILGTTYAKASASLEKLGFEVKRKDVEQTTDTGLVVALDKSGRLRDGSTVVLSVAVLPAVAPVPNTSTSSGSGGGASSGAGGGTSSSGPTKGKGAPKAKPKGKGAPKPKPKGRGKN